MRDFRHLVIATIGSSALIFQSIFSPASNTFLNQTIPSTYNIQDHNVSEAAPIFLSTSPISNNYTNSAATAVTDNSDNSDNSIQSFSLITNKENTLPLIYDSKSIDYKSYIPKMKYNDDLKAALDIDNPDITVSASSAVLFNATTGEVLYYKKPVSAVFPSSTAKLLSSLVALDWCKKDEKVKVGSEVTLIPSDSSTANLKQGEILTVSNLLEAMLLPSGNDAAYVMAVHVGKKSLKNSKAKNMDAIKEFVKLMNKKAKELGVQNSKFVTPDGYDAIGQYTTAYDMGLIGLAAINNKTILSITGKCSSTRTIASGQRHTWTNTNNLLNKSSKWYYSNAIGLKTGTTSIAGRCLISAARQGDDVVVSVVMNSTSEGRWSDSLKLLKYGLKKLN